MAARTALLILIAALCAGTPGAARAQAADTDKALERLKLEPTCPEVQDAALAYFNINKQKVQSLRNGAAYKALVPVLELSGGYASADLDENTFNYLEFPGDVPWLTKGSGGTAWDARGKVAWNLPGLVFNAEVLDVASLAGLVQGILKEVTRLYYMRRRLQLDLILNPPTDEATRLTKELRLEELSALLDAMTGGYFGKEVARRGLAPGALPSPTAKPAPDAGDLFR